jgi:hypothetical protein
MFRTMFHNGQAHFLQRNSMVENRILVKRLGGILKRGFTLHVAKGKIAATY